LTHTHNRKLAAVFLPEIKFGDKPANINPVKLSPDWTPLDPLLELLKQETLTEPDVLRFLMMVFLFSSSSFFLCLNLNSHLQLEDYLGSDGIITAPPKARSRALLDASQGQASAHTSPSSSTAKAMRRKETKENQRPTTPKEQVIQSPRSSRLSSSKKRSWACTVEEDSSEGEIENTLDLDYSPRPSPFSQANGKQATPGSTKGKRKKVKSEED